MKLFKLLLAAAGATVLLGTLVATASARNLSISNRSIRSTWSSVIFTGGFGEANCHVTLEGTLHERTMVKSLGTLMGYITSAIVFACPVGSATILRETLPWHVKYSGFEGPLPEITSIRVHVIGSAWRIRERFGATCLARTELNQPAKGIFHRNIATHVLTEVGIEGEIRVGAECLGATGRLSGRDEHSGTISLLGTTNAIEVSLI
jgi:hypothetical protein